MSEPPLSVLKAHVTRAGSDDPLVVELGELRDLLQHFRHPNRQPRTGRDFREALGELQSVAGVHVDRLNHALGDCGEFCVHCSAVASKAREAHEAREVAR